MLKLSEIKLVDATAQDMARALNYAMQKSKKTAHVITGQLDLFGYAKAKHVLKMYPEDTFTKKGKLNPLTRKQFASEMQKVFKHPKPINEFNMIDYANAIIKCITKNG